MIVYIDAHRDAYGVEPLEADGLVWRWVEATVPPNVTYGLTERGAALAPIFDALAVWHLGAAAVKRGRPAGWEA